MVEKGFPRLTMLLINAMIYSPRPKLECDLDKCSTSPPTSLSKYKHSSASLRSSCHRAIQQKRRSSCAINLRTRQMHRCSRGTERSRLQTPAEGWWSQCFPKGRLLLAGGACLAIDWWGYLTHPSSTRDGVAGVLIDGDHGLAFRADVLGIDWLRLATSVIGTGRPTSIAPEMPFRQLMTHVAGDI